MEKQDPVEWAYFSLVPVENLRLDVTLALPYLGSVNSTSADHWEASDLTAYTADQVNVPACKLYFSYTVPILERWHNHALHRA